MSLIVQLSDIHFGSEDADAIARCEAHIKEAAPDLLVICGDLTQRGRRREFDAAAEWLSGFDMPKLIVPGNHDTPMFDLASRALDPFARFKRHFEACQDEVRVKGIVAVGLNTARGWQVRRNWAEGSVDLEDLDEAIVRAGEQKADMKLLACHHPFRSLPHAPLRVRTRRGRRACDKVAASHIQMVLTGHVHTPSAVLRQRANGAYLAVSSGTLSTRLRAEPPSFNMIRLENDQIDISRCDLIDGQMTETGMGRFDAHFERSD
ncbi:MAG: metallophosphoesterase [Alphaproteobacteria bacterium]|nr:hypothetical protein [Hyphomonas sp.]MBR9806105.1 metallophosphoesterase [Alphaproteobacteria bacterium]